MEMELSKFFKKLAAEMKEIEKAISSNIDEPDVPEKIQAALGGNVLKPQLESQTPLRDTPEEAMDESVNHTVERMQKTVEVIEKRIKKIK